MLYGHKLRCLQTLSAQNTCLQGLWDDKRDHNLCLWENFTFWEKSRSSLAFGLLRMSQTSLVATFTTSLNIPFVILPSWQKIILGMEVFDKFSFLSKCNESVSFLIVMWYLDMMIFSSNCQEREVLLIGRRTCWHSWNEQLPRARGLSDKTSYLLTQLEWTAKSDWSSR